MGTPCIRQRKGNWRLLLLTHGFTVIPAWKIKPVLINSDSRCLELRIGHLLCGNVGASLPVADPRFLHRLPPSFSHLPLEMVGFALARLYCAHRT